ncbi:hypothetical protein N3K66_003746 [Trichothecium roseum]|uniref:Uncharacterized protein n=1 Tax=Trichothecium roseum TaxID=47278 RepID=A0ACC0V6G0_9HYPO|nr:hypothetical protein N3K66_003746 [Trichothecium roseum]
MSIISKTTAGTSSSSSVVIEPSEVVLVTGANGFIAQHCIALLLKRGYRVVGTARTADKAKLVERTHHHHPCLSVVVVADITSRESYLSVMRDSEPAAVVHMASPFSYDVELSDFEANVMRPAVDGTLALLGAAAKAGTSCVRRVVLTSSLACVLDPALGRGAGKTYTAEDWSPLTYEDGVAAADAPSAYRASKTAAERAAWDFVTKEKPAFDLVSLCPGMVFGPWLEGAEPRTLKGVNTSNEIVWDVLSAGGDARVPATRAPVWVDVRDAAAAHVGALSGTRVGGKRYAVAAGVYCNQEIADLCRGDPTTGPVGADGTGKSGCREGVRMTEEERRRVPVGQPGKREAHLHFAVDDGGRAERELGIGGWRGLGECLGDLVPQLLAVERGC